MWDVYVYFSLLFLSLACWLSRFRDLSPALKALGVPLLATLVMEGYAAYLMFQMTNTVWLYHFITPVQYTLYAFVFYHGLAGAGIKKTVLVSVPLYLLASLFIILQLQSSSEYNSYARLMKDALIVCCALVYYWEVFTKLQVIRLAREPMFWVSTGLLFYSLGNFFADGLMNQLLEQSYRLAHAVFYINVFLGLLLHATFLVAFWLTREQPAVPPCKTVLP